MSSSFSVTESFTVVHARHMASKVATDLLRFQRFYSKPTNESIDAYEAEVAELLKEDYLRAVAYGFQRNGKWVEGLRYRSLPGGVLVADDDPGKLQPGADISNCQFASFLEYNDRWFAASDAERDRVLSKLPFQRSTGTEPGLEAGYWSENRTYSAGGRGIARSVIKRY
jgi:hypothetical protein